MKRYVGSVKVFYLSLFAMFFVVFFTKNIGYEPIEIGFIKKILNPEYSNNVLKYDPLLHYDYIVAFVAKWFGYQNNFEELARVFWFLENGFVVFVLIKLGKLVFKNDTTVLVVLIVIFLLLKSGETEQKTMARAFYLLAVYYFLNEKWIISAIFGSCLFYFHVGMAVWWFLPSCFALIMNFLIQKRISLRKIITYLFVVVILSSPIAIFYLGRLHNSTVDEFSNTYYYYSCWYCSSIMLSLIGNPELLIGRLVTVLVFITGYIKARKVGYKNDNIMLLVFGVFILYCIDFVLVDVLGNGFAMRLDLLRSMETLYLFSLLFLAFLLARQIKKGNYIFTIFLIFASTYDFIWSVLCIDTARGIIVFNIILIIYEIYENRISYFIERVIKRVERNINLNFFKKTKIKLDRLIQYQTIIAVFFIFIISPKLPILKSSVKSIFNIQQHRNVNLYDKKEALYDTVRYMNENIDKDSFLLPPFNEKDFKYYSNHKTFINIDTPIMDTTLGEKSSYEFKNILENDLDYSLRKLFLRGGKFHPKNINDSWKELWQKLDENLILQWKNKYHLTHVIRENELPLNFPIIYQNQFYAVYKI